MTTIDIAGAKTLTAVAGLNGRSFHRPHVHGGQRRGVRVVSIDRVRDQAENRLHIAKAVMVATGSLTCAW